MATAEQQLTEAFDAFNTLSAQLTGAYSELEERVARLTAELSAAQDGRLRELAGKQRLAARLEQLVAAMPAAMIVIDRDGIVRETNPESNDLLGNDLSGKDWEALREARMQPEGADYLLPDGRRVSLGERELGDGQGRIVVLHDVSETRALQESLHHQQRLTELGEMAASLAHQVRTPLASALLYAGHLARPVLDDDRRLVAAERIRGRLLRLEGLVRDMLAFARRDAGGHDEVDAASLFAELVATLQPQLDDAGVTLRSEDRSAGSRVRGSRDALAGALSNLAVNALQAGATQLTLRARHVDGESLLLQLQDNGPGMPAEILEQACEPFFSTRTDGTGLGLAVVRTVVQAHHGRIDLASAPDSGTTVTLTLPLATVPAPRSPE